MSKKKNIKENTTLVDYTWKIPKKGVTGEWYPIVRIGRHVPFGYEQDENDPDLLLPIPRELELLEKAKKFLNQDGYGLRPVARWLTAESGRYISHVGLHKRVTQEEKRRRKAGAYEQYSKRAEEAAEKARKLSERLGGYSTRKAYAEDSGDDE